MRALLRERCEGEGPGTVMVRKDADFFLMARFECEFARIGDAEPDVKNC